MSENRFRAWDRVTLKDYEEKTHPVHGPALFYKDVVIAREIVQEYDDGKAWKPADELEKSTPFAAPRWAVSSRHPETGLLMDMDDIHGLTENPRFVKNLKDHGRTGRENNRGIMVDLWAFLKYISPQVAKEMKDGKRQDVSIGFVFTKDETPGTVSEGPLKGESYDYIQKDIFNDHLTFGINNGRCPMPYCGLGADSKVPPSVTENAKRLLAQQIDRGNMAVKTDLSIAEINKKIKELKDKLEAKRSEINKLYDEARALFEEAEKDSKPIYAKIDLMWADWQDVYDEMTAYREAKILLLTKNASAESLPKETDEDKTARAQKFYGFTADEWGTHKNLQPVLLQKLPALDLKPCVDKTREVLLSHLVGDSAAIKAVLETSVTLSDKGEPEIANDITRKLTAASICWPCLDEFTYDYKKAPEDTAWEYSEADYTPQQLSYASSVVQVGDTVHGFGYTGEDLTKEACHLPHHEPGDGSSHGGTLVWNGVKAAGGVLSGARGGVKISDEAKDKAKAHLAKHYREFEQEPPWEKEDKTPKKTGDLLKASVDETNRTKHLLGDNRLEQIPATLK